MFNHCLINVDAIFISMLDKTLLQAELLSTSCHTHRYYIDMTKTVEEYYKFKERTERSYNNL